MRGILILADGRELKLPLLTSWRTCHTMGEPCDCFELTCPLDTTFEALAETAVRFRGEHNGSTVFYGVPDEIRFTYSEKGLVLFVSGRGMAALLMDNQFGEAELAAVTLEELCRMYAAPLGIEYDMGIYGGITSALTVTASSSCWKVISGFTKSLLARCPGFTKEGKMVLEKKISVPLVINEATAAVLTLKRYGVISQLYVNGAGAIYNENALSRGIQCSKVVPATAPARYQMEMAEQGYFTLTVTVPDAFAAFPGDRVELNCGMFDGVYLVSEAESTGDSSGCYCTLTLKREEI